MNEVTYFINGKKVTWIHTILWDLQFKISSAIKFYAKHPWGLFQCRHEAPFSGIISVDGKVYGKLYICKKCGKHIIYRKPL